MTKIYGITILNNSLATQSVSLAEVQDVSTFNYFQRKGAQEFMTFTSNLVTQKTQKGQRQSVKQEEYMCHCFCRADGLAGVLMTNDEYPNRIAFTLIGKLLEEFAQKVPTWNVMQSGCASGTHDKFPALAQWLVKYQDPAQADALCRVQKELDETKVVLHQTLEGLLNRGEKLDDLVSRSDMLSQSSKAFYTTARKTNSWCCTIM